MGMKTSDKDTILVFGVIIAFLFFTYLMPLLEKQFNQDKQILKEGMQVLGNDHKINKFDTKQCSKNCCLHTQWSVPHIKNEPPKGYVGSNLMCANGSGGGCLCVTAKDMKTLEERGGNRTECK
tara:strand:- start:7076 stop:7444 length:369 start_codon:yes stop_codon:yes gene_type:complete